ncbi:hypothetical protein D3C84_1165830 [compost metagenome]
MGVGNTHPITHRRVAEIAHGMVSGNGAIKPLCPLGLGAPLLKYFPQRVIPDGLKIRILTDQVFTLFSRDLSPE